MIAQNFDSNAREEETHGFLGLVGQLDYPFDDLQVQGEILSQKWS